MLAAISCSAGNMVAKPAAPAILRKFLRLNSIVVFITRYEFWLCSPSWISSVKPGTRFIDLAMKQVAKNPGKNHAFSINTIRIGPIQMQILDQEIKRCSDDSAISSRGIR
jgi:hypothetical protein